MDIASRILNNNSSWKIKEQIGEGGFASVYKCVHKETGVLRALKLQTSELDEDALEAEFSIYRHLQSAGRTTQNGIPEVYSFREGREFKYLSMQVLGTSLFDLVQDQFDKTQRGFSAKSVFMIAIRMLHILDYIHSKSVFHLDIKDQNIVIGPAGHENEIYLIDYGLSLFINSDGAEICGNRINVPVVSGTANMNKEENQLKIRNACQIRDYAGLLATLMWLYDPDRSMNMNVDPFDLDDPNMWQSRSHIKKYFEGFPVEFEEFLGLYLFHSGDSNPTPTSLIRPFRRAIRAYGWIDDNHFDWCPM